MKLSIGVINFNSGRRLRQCLEAIAAHPPSVPFEVIVIDNDSKDGSGDFLLQEAARFPWVRYEKVPANLGFTGGYNRAFRKARGEYFFVYNADIVARPGAFDAIVQHMEDDDSLGAIGGTHLGLDGRPEHYANRFPRPYDIYLTQFVRKEKAERNAGYRRYHLRDADFSKPLEAPQPAGGCLLVRRKLFPEGLMSDAFGVFWSDVEMARKVYAKGKRCMIFPDAAFTHDHDWSPKPVTETRLLVDLDYYVGCYRYFRMYDGWWAAQRVRLLFGARLLGRLLLIELPKAMRKEETWSLFRARRRLLWNFLRNRNVLLERETVRARAAGVLV